MKMSLYIDFVEPVKAWHNRQEADVLDIMAEVYKTGHQIENTSEMVKLCIRLSGMHKKLIQGITFASHGSKAAFHIGTDRITPDAISPHTQYPKVKGHIYPALKSLRPYFARENAWVRIDACSCGLDDTFLKSLSQLE
jgi:hypothetical protein